MNGIHLILIVGWTFLVLAFGFVWGFNIGYDKGLSRAYGREVDNG